MTPKIGLLSDSHGRVERTQQAVRALIERGAGILIHLGDINSTGVLDSLVEGVDETGQLRPRVHVVPGNTDWNPAELSRHALSLGIEFHDPAGQLTLGGKTLAFQHGHHLRELSTALERGVDYLFHGHTHERRDERVGSTRIINPGALHRARIYTVALLEVESDELEWIEVER